MAEAILNVFLKLINSLFIYLFICPCLIQISVDPRTCTEKQLFHFLFVAETSARRSINEVFPGDLGRSLGLTRQWTVGAEPSNFSWEAKKTVKWKVFADIYTWFSKAALGIGQLLPGKLLFGGYQERLLKPIIAMIWVYSVFTWRHGGHDVVPNQSCGNWTLFWCKRFLLFQ